MSIRFVLVVALVSWLAAGCGLARDVSHDTRYSKYTVGGEYRLVAPSSLVLADQDDFGTGTRYALIDPAERIPQSEVVEGRTVATLAPGTRLRIEKVVASRYRPRFTRSWEVVRPLARVLTGRYRGLLVDLSGISHHKLVRPLNADIASPANSHLRLVKPKRPASPPTQPDH